MSEQRCCKLTSTVSRINSLAGLRSNKRTRMVIHRHKQTLLFYRGDVNLSARSPVVSKCWIRIKGISLTSASVPLSTLWLWCTTETLVSLCVDMCMFLQRGLSGVAWTEGYILVLYSGWGSKTPTVQPCCYYCVWSHHVGQKLSFK